ncbi:protein FAM110A isoform 1-T2 [Synchiropus picturatus]
MPVEALKQPIRPPARNVVNATYPRLKPKGPVGPDFFRRFPPASVGPRQSAVERLEADKAKYVKSQQALSKPPSVRPPESRQPLLSPGSASRPTKKTPTQPKPKQEGVQLNLEHLSSLISDVNDEPASAPSPERTTARNREGPPVPTRNWSSPAKVRLKASTPVKVEGTPPVGTIRRVDVKPMASPVRTPTRPPQFIRQPLQPIPLHPQFPLRPATSHRRLFPLRPTPSPLKPVVPHSEPEDSPPAQTPVASPPSIKVLAPPSPAFTRLSSSSSRKRPSLTRSKSDMSDRFSRAGTELERFFNLCGLDPADLQELTGSSSDIVSLARFRSVSAPGSECAGSDRQEDDGGDDDDDDEGKATERVPYGVSVIERNARVIKWLYGIRQVKDASPKNTNL